MNLKAIIATAMFSIATGSVFAQGATTTVASTTEAAVQGRGSIGAEEKPVGEASAVHTTYVGKTREQVLEELAEYKRQNPRGYLYSYYLGK